MIPSGHTDRVRSGRSSPFPARSHRPQWANRRTPLGSPLSAIRGQPMDPSPPMTKALSRGKSKSAVGGEGCLRVFCAIFLIVELVATLFWNGIVAVFLFQVLGGFHRGRPEWFLTIFLIPFLLVGLALIADREAGPLADRVMPCLCHSTPRGVRPEPPIGERVRRRRARRCVDADHTRPDGSPRTRSRRSIGRPS